MNDSKLGRIFAIALKILIAVTVMLFLGINSINFFTFVFKAEQSLYAYLGFALTGGGVIAYLAILKWDSKTTLGQFVAISMLALCVVGELATAGFGMRIQSLEKMGLEFTSADLDNMILVVQLLALVHALALILKVAGTDIGEMFKKTNALAQATAPIPVDADNWLQDTVKKFESKFAPAPTLKAEEKPELGDDFQGGETP